MTDNNNNNNNNNSTNFTQQHQHEKKQESNEAKIDKSQSLEEPKQEKEQASDKDNNNDNDGILPEDALEGDVSTHMFEEPEGFRVPDPEPTTQQVSYSHGTLNIRLVGSHPLWGHYVWNAARCLCTYYLDKPEFCKDKRIIELGAGAGVPSLVAALNGAKQVLTTDYPDHDLLENLDMNVKNNTKQAFKEGRIHTAGLRWNAENMKQLVEEYTQGEGFDVVVQSDLIFNHAVHHELLQTTKHALSKSPSACVLVAFSHHRPKKAHLDMRYFELAQEYGFQVEKQFDKYYGPMFERDFGSLELRSTVYVYKMWLKQE